MRLSVPRGRRLQTPAWPFPQPIYPRFWIKLRRDGWLFNRKRVHRLYREKGLAMRPHKPRRHRSYSTRIRPPAVSRPNESWSMDFMGDEFYDGRRFLLSTIVDDFTRESLAVEVGQHLTGRHLANVLGRLCRSRSRPERVRVDNGTEFTSKRLYQWPFLHGVKLEFSRRGKPTDYELIEAFNGRQRAERLDENWF
jgi:putative transposase